MFATATQQTLYKHLLKPIFFRCDPERVHDLMTGVGKMLGHSRVARACLAGMMRYTHSALVQDIRGIMFQNPVGLTAGFDKDAQLTRVMPSVGFGFEVIGSVTARPCAGNPKPRLWRLPKSKGLVVYYGLKNDGAKAIYERMVGRAQAIPIGVSIAKTNDAASVGVQEGIEDYLTSLETLQDIGDFVVLNVSCPNAHGGETFATPERLERLLASVRQRGVMKPLFLKLPVDLSVDELDALMDVTDRYQVDGLILSNLTKDRTRTEIDQEEVAGMPGGGISGKPAAAASTALIRHAYQRAPGRYVLVGVGGIFSAEDAYEKICAGASLVQLCTGMIFEGPQLIGEINKGLVELLKNDGFTSIEEAVGSAHR